VCLPMRRLWVAIDTSPESPDRTAAPVAVMKGTGQAHHLLAPFAVHRPQGGTTSKAIQPLAGRVSGGAVKGIVVHLNGRQQLLDAWQNTFEGEVILRPGRNQIRVVAMGGPCREIGWYSTFHRRRRR
jgi:hypothetical protein